MTPHQANLTTHPKKWLIPKSGTSKTKPGEDSWDTWISGLYHWNIQKKSPAGVESLRVLAIHNRPKMMQNMLPVWYPQKLGYKKSSPPPPKKNLLKFISWRPNAVFVEVLSCVETLGVHRMPSCLLGGVSESYRRPFSECSWRGCGEYWILQRNSPILYLLLWHGHGNLRKVPVHVYYINV